MQVEIWEDYISLNSRTDYASKSLGPVSQYLHQADGTVVWDTDRLAVQVAVERDTAPLPTTEDREGYYGDNHYNFWASGLRDLFQITDWCDANGVNIDSYLDVGCASGRLLRHLHHQTGISSIVGCDINRAHVDWVTRHLPLAISVFQNTSIPTLPLADGSVDFLSAFSVMTHIESFDTTWLMEFRRILRPGGIAWLTFHSSRTWAEMTPGWPIYDALATHPDFSKFRGKPLASDRLIFRWRNQRSYSSNVFYSESYIRRNWGRILEFIEVIPCQPSFQDTAIFRKAGP